MGRRFLARGFTNLAASPEGNARAAEDVPWFSIPQRIAQVSP